LQIKPPFNIGGFCYIKDMIIQVFVKTQSKKNEVIKVSESEFVIKTTAPAHERKANEAVIKLLANYFRIRNSQVEIKSGIRNKRKKIEIILATG